MDPVSPMKSNISSDSDQPFADTKSPTTTTLSPNLSFPSNIENVSLANQDCRESLGILPSDFEKDSNFLNITDKDLLDFKNIVCLEDSDIGRESLGILQLNNLDINFGNENEKAPDIMLSFIENVESCSRVLDTGFLLSSPSHLLSITSQNSMVSFNSNSLEFPSKIFTLTKNEFSSSVFSPSHSLLNNAKIMSPSRVDSRSRISSQPMLTANNQIEVGTFFWSTGRPAKSKMVSTGFSCIKLNFNDEKDDMFHDSVFIEGNHIAQKIADGSFLNDHYENVPLDSTPQPEWPNELDESRTKSKETPDSRTDTNTVFKAVDKLLPNTMHTNTEVSLKSSRSSSSSSKSKDAKEILQNLSDIFNTTHKSEQQKSQGRALLHNLVEMLNNTHLTTDEGLEDSGHSSITDQDLDKNKPDSDELMNLEKKVLGSVKKIDSSVNSATTETTSKIRLSQSIGPVKKLPQKLARRSSSSSAMDASSNRIRSHSNSSVKSNDNNGSTVGSKIKPKIGSIGTKKGPLRAVLPVTEMRKGHFTPDKSEQKTVQLHSKKTSTPINEPQLKPVAASTPTGDNRSDNKCSGSPKWSSRKSTLNRSNSLNEQNVNIRVSKDSSGVSSTSKLRRPSFSSSSPREKINTSSSIPSKLQEQYKMGRRNSVTEGVVNHQLRTKRSNSVGKESGMMSSLRKVRENILKSPYYDNKTGILVDSNAKVATDVEKKVTFRRSFNSSIKSKKSEKENVY